MRAASILRCSLAATVVLAASSAFAADDGAWSVKKSSGDVWIGTAGVQQASLKADEVLKPGDTIRTGRNGRVLVVRGEETILIAPNSVVGLPSVKKEGLATTIIQQAGSILLEVEKKNVKHFEVETPYLAAVVKGTQFRVTVRPSGATVDVVRGQVQVSDFRSGQMAVVMPGQHATAVSHGNAGLTLGGSGTFQPIQHGQPRATSVERVPVPRNGLSASSKAGATPTTQQRNTSGGPRQGATRISSSLGEVRLNVHRVTNGLARNTPAAPGARSVNRDNATVWETPRGSGQGNGNGNGGAAGSRDGNGSSSVAAVVGSGTGGSSVNANANASGNGNAGGVGNNGNGNAGGNGNNGNGNGNAGNGNNGNGNGNAGGNGNNGNGNGNAGGNGNNGNGNGNAGNGNNGNGNGNAGNGNNGNGNGNAGGNGNGNRTASNNGNGNGNGNGHGNGNGQGRGRR